MLIVGFSTGAVAFGDFDRALHLLDTSQANAVELSALRLVELIPLIHALPSRLAALRGRYQYISFHAPTDFKSDRDVVGHLVTVAEMGLNIVAHPDTITDPSQWRALGKHLCIENMDSRKSTGRTAVELSRFFDALPEARLCFDIAHARQVDPTMTEASKIVTRYRDRMVQTHFSELDSRGKHFPISFGAKRPYELFSAVLSTVPAIVESVVAEAGIGIEIEKVREILSFRSPRRSPEGASIGHGYATL